MTDQELPLVHLGPNLNYGTSFYGTSTQVNGKSKTRLIAVVGGTKSDRPPRSHNASPRSFFDRIFGIDRIDFTPAVAASNIWDLISQVSNNSVPNPSRTRLVSMYLQHFTTVGKLVSHTLRSAVDFICKVQTNISGATK